MNIENLRMFLAIYEMGSVSGAAQALGMTQSGASAALSRLRDLFADELFIRTGRGMEPTAYAQSIAGPTRRLIQAADQILESKAPFDPMLCHDEFRVVTGDILEGTLVGALMNAFSRFAPNARLTSLAPGQNEIEGALASGRIDACLGTFSDLGPNVYQTTISPYSFACFCSVSHPLAGKRITQAQFSEARYIVMDSESNLFGTLEAWLRVKKISRNIKARTAHFQGIPRIIRETDLIAIVPTDADHHWLFDGDVGRIELDFDLPCPDLNIYWHRTYNDDQRNMWLRRLIVDAMRDRRERLARAYQDAGLMAD